MFRLNIILNGRTNNTDTYNTEGVLVCDTVLTPFGDIWQPVDIMR